MGIKRITSIRSCAEKRVLVRVDFNVPLDEHKKVVNDQRIEAALPTIRFLRKKKAKVILITHIGQPKSRKDGVSTKIIVPLLREKLGIPIHFVSDCIGEKVYHSIDRMRGGDMLLLENLRFYPGEEKNDSEFAQNLALLGDYYVNDAFSVSHRAHASIVGVPAFIPGYAGFSLLNEITNIDRAVSHVKQPAVAIIGGVKIQTKIDVIANLSRTFSSILIGGGIANTFFAAQGIPIGKSIFDDGGVAIAKKIMRSPIMKKIVLPSDVVIARTLAPDAPVSILPIADLKKMKKKDFYIIDIGPRTLVEFASILFRAHTLIWNGPVGMFEYTNFAHGSLVLANLFAHQAHGPAFGLVGGGETIEIFDQAGAKEWVDFVSTGGGALLCYLEGKGLPGITAVS